MNSTKSPSLNVLRAVFRMGDGLMAVPLRATQGARSRAIPTFSSQSMRQRAGEDLMSQGLFSVDRGCWPPERCCPQA